MIVSSIRLALGIHCVHECASTQFFACEDAAWRIFLTASYRGRPTRLVVEGHCSRQVKVSQVLDRTIFCRAFLSRCLITYIRILLDSKLDKLHGTVLGLSEWPKFRMLNHTSNTLHKYFGRVAGTRLVVVMQGYVFTL